MSKMKELKTELTNNINDFYDGIVIDSQTVEMPSCMLVQDKAEVIDKAGVSAGDYVDISTDRVLADRNTNLEVCIFYKKEFIMQKFHTDKSDKGAFVKMMPFNNMPYEVPVKGGFLRNQKAVHFFMFIKQKDVWDTSLPYILKLKGGSYSAGKVISTQVFARNLGLKALPCSTSIVLGRTKKIDSKNNKWLVPSVAIGQAVPYDVQRKCVEWLPTCKIYGQDTNDEEVVETPVLQASSPVIRKDERPAEPLGPPPTTTVGHEVTASPNIVQQDIPLASHAKVEAVGLTDEDLAGLLS